MAHQWGQQVIIITGASSGIGKALAYALAPHSPRLVLASRDRGRLEAVAKACERLGATTLVVPTDVADPQACHDLIQATIDTFSRLDVLVNNAGMSMWSNVEDIQRIEQFKHLLEVNFLGSVYCTKYALPFLKQSHGRIVAISSVTSFTGIPSHAIYSASKHAMNGFFESLRIELDGTGVSVTIVAPDFVQTEIFERSLGADGHTLGLHLRGYDSFLRSEACAAIIIQAMARRKRLVVTSLRGKLGRWVKLCWPQAIDWIARRGVEEVLRK
ncbi:MAG: SDR family oxidoreductase [Nitrospirota bacterium]|nr:SDR family oxidoreductase [Nitrospirota bacterium]